ncbi:MAG: fibronectin type III domain-containing protein [Planctomycetales bacterium]|nr:fibronectin type III domain-containing protein [Planctomycetales bacterium]
MRRLSFESLEDRSLLSGTGASGMGIPSAPSNLMGMPGATLSWHDESFNEESFRVERRADSEAIWSELAELDPDTTHYHDNSAVAEEHYHYRIVATNSLGSSTSTGVKVVSRDDGLVFSLGSDHWLRVNGAPIWGDTADFHLTPDRTLYWLSSTGMLQRLPQGHGWMTLDQHVAHFSVRDDGLAFSLDEEGWLKVEGSQVWSNTRSFHITEDQSLIWLGANGALQELREGTWSTINSNVQEFAAWSNSIVYVTQDNSESGEPTTAWTSRNVSPGLYSVELLTDLRAKFDASSPLAVFDAGLKLVEMDLSSPYLTESAVGWDALGGPYVFTGDWIEVRLAGSPVELAELAGAVRFERLAGLPETELALGGLPDSARATTSDYLNRLNHTIEGFSEGDVITTDLWSTVYPAMLAINDLSAYVLTGYQRYLDRAVAQLNYSLTQENEDGLFVAELSGSRFIGRDSLARHIFSLYVGYKITGDPVYLQHAEQNANAAIEHLQSTATAETAGYELFYSVYDSETYAPQHPPFLNPNQDAALGTAFLLLASDPDSTLFNDAELMRLAQSQLAASMVLQRSDGALADAAPYDFPPASTCFDTGYGAYTMWWWAIANQISGNDPFEHQMSLGANWLTPFSDVDTPFELSCTAAGKLNPASEDYDIRAMRMEEFFDRLLLFVESEQLPPGFGNQLFRYMTNDNGNISGQLGMQFPLAVLEVLGYQWRDLVPDLDEYS